VKALRGWVVKTGVNLAQKLNATVVSVLHHANSSSRKITTLMTIKVLVTEKNFFI
jgi:hypothetical protein